MQNASWLCQLHVPAQAGLHYIRVNMLADGISVEGRSGICTDTCHSLSIKLAVAWIVKDVTSPVYILMALYPIFSEILAAQLVERKNKSSLAAVEVVMVGKNQPCVETALAYIYKRCLLSKGGSIGCLNSRGKAPCRVWMQRQHPVLLDHIDASVCRWLCRWLSKVLRCSVSREHDTGTLCNVIADHSSASQDYAAARQASCIQTGFQVQYAFMAKWKCVAVCLGGCGAPAPTRSPLMIRATKHSTTVCTTSH